MKSSNIAKRIMNFIVRGILGVVFIYFINIFFLNQGIAISVGVNAVTFCVTGLLGVPGVGLLYGISVFHYM